MKRVTFFPVSLAVSASYSTPSSLISVSSSVVFLLTAIIGNFGVSDADVVLTQPRNDLSTGHYPNIDHHTAFGDPTSKVIPPFSTTTNTIPKDLQATPENVRVVRSDRVSEFHGVKSAQNVYKNESPKETLSTSLLTEPPAVQATFKIPLIPISLPLQRPYSPQIDGYHKRRKRVTVADNPASIPSGEDNDPPISLLMGDYGNLDRGRLLDQLVIRALANPEAWAELRQSFDSVNEKLHLLHSLESQSSPTVVDDSEGKEALRRNRSLVMSKSVDAEKRMEYHDSPKWKFTYHRVHDLNAAGHPTLRAIAAVVSQERAIDSESVVGENKTGQNNSLSLKGIFSDKESVDRGNISQGSANVTSPLVYKTSVTLGNGDFKGRRVSQKQRNWTVDKSESGSGGSGVDDRIEWTNNKMGLDPTENKLQKDTESEQTQWELPNWGRRESSSNQEIRGDAQPWSIPVSRPQYRQKGESELQQQLESYRAHRHHHGSNRRHYHHRHRQPYWKELSK